MAYNSNNILYDITGVNPAPQFFDDVNNTYSPLFGIQNASANAEIAATFSGSTGVIPSSNTDTSFNIDLGSLSISSGNTSIYNAKNATLAIVNSGTGQIINSLTLVNYDNVGGQEVDINYSITNVSVINDGYDIYNVALSSGLIQNFKLDLGFGTAPINGEVYAKLIAQN